MVGWHGNQDLLDKDRGVWQDARQLAGHWQASAAFGHNGTTMRRYGTAVQWGSFYRTRLPC